MSAIIKKVFYANTADFRVMSLAICFVKTEINRGAPYFIPYGYKESDLLCLLRCFEKPDSEDLSLDLPDSKVVWSNLTAKAIHLLVIAISHGVTPEFLEEYALKRAYREYCEYRIKKGNDSSFNMFDRVEMIKHHYALALCEYKNTVEKLVNLVSSEC